MRTADENLFLAASQSGYNLVLITMVTGPQPFLFSVFFYRGSEVRDWIWPGTHSIGRKSHPVLRRAAESSIN